MFAYGRPCDMRKSYNTLSGLVLSMGHDLTTGDVFLFIAKNRKTAKALWYDGTGLRLLGKRHDQGRLAAVWDRRNGDAVELTMSELALFFDGCEVVGRQKLVPPRLDVETASRVSSSDFR